jgi:hypothetical protein
MKTTLLTKNVHSTLTKQTKISNRFHFDSTTEWIFSEMKNENLVVDEVRCYLGWGENPTLQFVSFFCEKNPTIGFSFPNGCVLIVDEKQL